MFLYSYHIKTKRGVQELTELFYQHLLDTKITQDILVQGRMIWGMGKSSDALYWLYITLHTREIISPCLAHGLDEPLIFPYLPTQSPLSSFFSLFYYILLHRYTRGQQKLWRLVPTPIQQLTHATLASEWAYTVLGAIFLLQWEHTRTYFLRMRVRRIKRGFDPRESRKMGNFIMALSPPQRWMT